MRKRIFFVLLVSVLFASCTTTKYAIQGNYELQTTSTNLKEVKIIRNDQIYTDEFVTIQPKLDSDKIVSLIITNHHNSTIRILWDEAAFVDGRGSSHRIMHAGTKYGDKEKEQIPYVIPSNAYMSTAITPIDANNVYLWANNGLYTEVQQAQKALERYKEIPHIVRLLFPLEIDGQKVEYMMNFEIENWGITGVKVEDTTEGGSLVLILSAVAILGTILTGM